MEFVLLALGGCGALVAGLRLRSQRRHASGERERAGSELAATKQLAEADAVLFGEELARLDARVADAELDEEARVDYRTALEAYETSLRLVDRLASADKVGAVVDALAAGRYAAACVLARVDGAPLPTFRIPCFFDPRHGPAAIEVMWSPPGQGTRKVPACAQDAARHAEGERVEVTMVRIDGRKVPYFSAGTLQGPYVHGHERRPTHDAANTGKAYHEVYRQQPEQYGPF